MDTSNQQTAIITVWVVMTVLAAITVGMRFYTRRLILHILGPEDWLILIAMVCSCRGSAAPVSLLNAPSFRSSLLEHVWASSAVNSQLARAPPTVGSELTPNRNLLWPGTAHRDA